MPETKTRPIQPCDAVVKVTPDTHRRLVEMCEAKGYAMGRLSDRLIREGLDRLEREGLPRSA